MLSEFRKRKLTMAFYRLDTTQDGYLSMDDMVLCGRRVAALQGFDVGSPEHVKTVEAFRQSWHTMLMPEDTTGDGRLTVADYIGRIETLRQMVEMQQLALDMNATFFDLVDFDQNGKIEAGELAILLQSLGIHSDDAHLAFNKVDRDGDGFITREEYAQGLYEHHLSEDPNAPGNWILGPY